MDRSLRWPASLRIIQHDRICFEAARQHSPLGGISAREGQFLQRKPRGFEPILPMTFGGHEFLQHSEFMTFRRSFMGDGDSLPQDDLNSYRYQRLIGPAKNWGEPIGIRIESFSANHVTRCVKSCLALCSELLSSSRSSRL